VIRLLAEVGKSGKGTFLSTFPFALTLKKSEIFDYCKRSIDLLENPQLAKGDKILAIQYLGAKTPPTSTANNRRFI
jgi:hypothetical protein